MELQSTLPQDPKGARRLGRALPDIGRKKNPLHSALSGLPVPNGRRWFAGPRFTVHILPWETRSFH